MKTEENLAPNPISLPASMEVMDSREAALLRYYQLSQSGLFPIMYEDRNGMFRVGLALDERY